MVVVVVVAIVVVVVVVVVVELNDTHQYALSRHHGCDLHTHVRRREVRAECFLQGLANLVGGDMLIDDVDDMMMMSTGCRHRALDRW